MAKFRPIRRLRHAWSRLYGTAAERVRRFSRHTDEVLTEEPIDFSAPSIPYYENLANRLSFVRVVLYMVLLVFVVVTVISNHTLITYENLYYLAKDIGAATLTAQSRADTVSYPISSAGSDFSLFRGGMAIAGSEVVTVMSGSGRQTLSVNVSYADPCVRASDKYCLTFGRGENSFAVYNSFAQVHGETTAFPVYEAAVANDGSFAIVTRSRDYTSEVLLYDGNLHPTAALHLNGYCVGLSFNPEGDRLGIVSVEAVEGVWETKVTMVRIENRISEESVTLSGRFGQTCAFLSGDRMAVIFSDGLMIFKTDATVVGEVTFAGTTPILCAFGGGQVAILSETDADLSEDILTVYDRSGRTAYTLTLDTAHPIRRKGGATHLSLGDGVLFIRAGDTLFCLSDNGDTLTHASVSRDTLDVLPLGGDEVLVCTPAYAYRLDGEDFKKN